MTSNDIRQIFLKYFEKNGHKIVSSAPIIVKDDPTLMFTNAGMNQFKEYFLGNNPAEASRIANTQKCLRVSGKHNDLEEVGVDTYHHTMFEMLGNWSFGDYFKKEAIAWAWELLTKEYKLPIDRLYVTVFEGDQKDGLDKDQESADIWKNYIDEERILFCNKKDNFWEMGDTGPCGPCSEIHIDLRSEEERLKINGKSLVNADHDQVIELWNLVFMQFNRKTDGSLDNLPNKHVDTGMGLERIVRAIHFKNSNYDTDLFQNTIAVLELESGKKYRKDEKIDIAFRVIADHLRAVAFAISDGQLPDNNGAGYVIRRILRRAIRYGYSYLDFNQPFIFKLVDTLAEQFKEVFSNLNEQKTFVKKVIEQEEKTFLNTLNNGLKRFEKELEKELNIIDGKTAFELYDTYGFPIDLTQLLAKENNLSVDISGFEQELQKQKERSRADAKKTSGDWVVLEDVQEQFVGYDKLEISTHITRYRAVQQKGKTIYQIVLAESPFYAEGGGQIGDSGVLIGRDDSDEIHIFDTQKENNLHILLTSAMPKNISQIFIATIDKNRRNSIIKNHSSTHLLQAALKEVLGNHINQRGSLVTDKQLRFDFSHFQKVTNEELAQIEKLVNQKIREAIPRIENRNIDFDEAVSKGAMALFGEKYGDKVRMITFDPNFSIELCGGCHVENTSEIGIFKIKSESAVAAGVRRIEAITGEVADLFVADKLDLLDQLTTLLGNPKDSVKTLQQLKQENQILTKKLEQLVQQQTVALSQELSSQQEEINGIKTIIANHLTLENPLLKDLCFMLKDQLKDHFMIVLLGKPNDKPTIHIMVSDDLVKDKQINAGQLVREWAKEIKGGGGGQPFYAQAGGTDVAGLDKIAKIARKFLEEKN
jgi:alanyl-tRNA synthetase